MRLISCLVFLFSVSAVAQNKPQGLLEAIQVAIEYNPRTKSTNEILEAAKYSLKALRAESSMPSGNIYCSTSYSVSRSSHENLSYRTSESRSESCGVSGGFTVFDSGARKFRIESAKKRVESLDATFNTTDSFIENTRGGLAQSTKETYIHYIQFKEFIEFSELALQAYNTVQKINSDNLIIAKISDLQAGIEELKSAKNRMASEFEHFVTMPPDENMQGFADAILELEIPKSLADAIEIALNEGPDVRRRNLNVEMATFDVKATKASYGPRLDLGASAGIGDYRYYSDGVKAANRSQSAYVGLTLSIPLSPGKGARIKAAEAELRAALFEREEDINTVKHSLEETYQNIEDKQKQFMQQKENYEQQLAYILDILNRIEDGNLKTIDATKFVQDIGTLSSRFHNMLDKQVDIVRNRYNVQQTLGMLFEQSARYSTRDDGGGKQVYGPTLQ